METHLLKYTEELVRKAQKGDKAAIHTLYNEYAKAMFSICTRMVGAGSGAEDVLQEAFIIAFSQIHQLKNGAQFGGWLKRIVINECIKFGKKTFRWEDVDGEQTEQLIDEIEENVWAGIEMAQIHAQIKTLPDGCRQVFTLYAVEDISHKEIATSLGISESTSKSQYHRAKQLLKKRLMNV